MHVSRFTIPILRACFLVLTGSQEHKPFLQAMTDTAKCAMFCVGFIILLFEPCFPEGYNHLHYRNTREALIFICGDIRVMLRSSETGFGI